MGRLGALARPLSRVRAFTLVELAIVLMLITTIASISMWAYFSRPEVTLDNAIHLLARDMRIAESRAILLRHQVYLVFNPEGNGYRVVDEADSRGDGQSFERIDRRFDRDAIFEGVKVLPFGLAERGRILFPCDGREPSPGKLLLAYGNQTRCLEIESGSGRILVGDPDPPPPVVEE